MGQDFECEKCGHYPWMSKKFTEVNGVKHECKCNCHDAEFEKHKIYFTIGENGTWDYSSEWSKGKIITKKQWDQHLTKYGDSARDEAYKQGIAGYKDEGVREKRPEAFTDVGSNSRLDIDGKYIYYIEIVKLIVCPICRKSQFEDAVLYNLHRTSGYFIAKPETCLSEHKHEYCDCKCGRKICQITFRDYFGYEFPNGKYGSGGESSVADLRKLEKLWGSLPSNNTPVSAILRTSSFSEYQPQYLDVFRLAMKSDGKTDEVVGIRITR